MKILGLTVNRDTRVASHIFNALQKELVKYIDVEFHSHNFKQPIGHDYVKLCNRELIMKKTYSANYINNNFDVVITDAGFAYLDEEGNKINIRKMMLLEDQHGPYVKKYVKRIYPYLDDILVRYKNPLEKFHPYLLKKNIIHFPHSINPEQFYNMNLDRKYNFLSVGAMGKYYPLRNKIKNELSKFDKNGKIIPRPKEGDGKKGPIGNDYVKLLNQSKSVISCTATVKYTVIKTFEIPACGSVLLSDCTEDMKELGFKDGVNFVEMNSNNIIDKYKEYVLDDTQRARIAKSGEQLILNNHTTKHRVQQLLKELGV